MNRSKIPARFYGGPWNAETREVVATLTIRVEDWDDDRDKLRGFGLYRQNTDRPSRYDWEGWKL